MSDVFISYARSTAAQSQAAANALRGWGYSVWLDEQLPTHRTYSDVIEEELAAAKAVLVIWSSEAARSQWVKSEANRAREDDKLVQMVIDGARLPMPFDQIQCADLKGWAGDADAAGWRAILSSIAELTRMAPSAAPGAPSHGPAVAPKPAEPLLAVLAFDNLSGDPEMAYFSDGVSEEIQQTVARGADLKVIGRNSSFQFRGADKGSSHVASELGATHILDGSVRRSGPRVRISAQLVECAKETTLWSDRFDRDLTDVFALQDEIAGAVAAALKMAFAPRTAADAIDPATYDLFLRAQARMGGYDPEKRVQTIKMFERVVAEAPKFARAWTALARNRLSLVWFSGEAARQNGITRESARDAVETALNLDAGLWEVYVTLSDFEAWAHYEEREALYRTALEMAPNDPGCLGSMGEFLTGVGRRRDARDYIKRAHDLDPMEARWPYGHLGLSDRYDRDAWASLCARWPDNDMFALVAIHSAAVNGDWEGYDSFVSASRTRIANYARFRELVLFADNLRNPDPQFILIMSEQVRQEFSRTGTVVSRVLIAGSQLGMTEEVFGLIDQASFAHVFGNCLSLK